VEPEFASMVALAWQGKLDFNDLLNYAGRLEAAGNSPLAIVIYRTWLKRNQSRLEPFILFNLGVALTNEHDLAGAGEVYRRAIQLNPSFLQPRINLGLLLERQGDLAAALTEWRWVVAKASQADPDQQALRSLALNHLERNRADSA
jgi:tetratricopeptide (TPR) repeat protein